MRHVLSHPRKRKRQWVPNPRLRRATVLVAMLFVAIIMAYLIGTMAA